MSLFHLSEVLQVQKVPQVRGAELVQLDRLALKESKDLKATSDQQVPKDLREQQVQQERGPLDL